MIVVLQIGIVFRQSPACPFAEVTTAAGKGVLRPAQYSLKFPAQTFLLGAFQPPVRHDNG